MNLAEAFHAAQTDAAAIPAGDEFHRALILGMHRATEAVEEFDQIDRLRCDPRVLSAFGLLWRVILGGDQADPLPMLLAEWMGAWADAAAATEAADKAEFDKRPDAEALGQRSDAFLAVTRELEDRIVATPPTSFLGILAKIRFGNVYAGDNLAAGRIERDDSDPQHGVRLALERDLAGLLGIPLPQPAAGPQLLPVAAE